MPTITVPSDKGGDGNMNSTTKLAKHVVGNTALFAAAYQLSLKGWNVTLTTRSATGPDLYIHDVNGGSQSVQVKGISNLKDWPSAKNAGKSRCTWWIIIRGLGTTAEEAFIMTEEEVVARRNQWGWSEPLPSGKNAWDRIGFAPTREDDDEGEIEPDTVL